MSKKVRFVDQTKVTHDRVAQRFQQSTKPEFKYYKRIFRLAYALTGADSINEVKRLIFNLWDFFTKLPKGVEILSEPFDAVIELGCETNDPKVEDRLIRMGFELDTYVQAELCSEEYLGQRIVSEYRDKSEN